MAVLGCDGVQLAAPVSPEACTGKSCGWSACARDPMACKPRENACTNTAVTLRCDGKTGTYVADLAQTPVTKVKLDMVKITDPSDKITGLPKLQSLPGTLAVPLSGLAPGQIGKIKLCSYDGTAAADGQPFDCCNSSVERKFPAKACAKDIR